MFWYHHWLEKKETLSLTNLKLKYHSEHLNLQGQDPSWFRWVRPTLTPGCTWKIQRHRSNRKWQWKCWKPVFPLDLHRFILVQEMMNYPTFQWIRVCLTWQQRCLQGHHLWKLTICSKVWKFTLYPQLPAKTTEKKFLMCKVDHLIFNS